MSKQPKAARELSPDIAKLADAVASQHGVPPALVRAVIWVESNGNPAAVSPKGAMGLMQLMPLTAAGLGVQDPFNPHSNVDGGTRYLADLVRKYGNVENALAAYNWGPGNLDAAIRDNSGVPRGVQSYVASVQQRRMIEEERVRPTGHPFSFCSVELVCPSCSHTFEAAIEVKRAGPLYSFEGTKQ